LREARYLEEVDERDEALDREDGGGSGDLLDDELWEL